MRLNQRLETCMCCDEMQVSRRGSLREIAGLSTGAQSVYGKLFEVSWAMVFVIRNAIESSDRSQHGKLGINRLRILYEGRLYIIIFIK